MYMYYDRNGQPISDVLEWAKISEDNSYRVVKQDYTPNKMFWISTVWLGIDHDFSWDRADGPNPHPVIFETMAFDERLENANELPGGRKVHTGGEMIRTCTEPEALKAHQEILERYTAMETLLMSPMAQSM